MCVCVCVCFFVMVYLVTEKIKCRQTKQIWNLVPFTLLDKLVCAFLRRINVRYEILISSLLLNTLNK